MSMAGCDANSVSSSHIAHLQYEIMVVRVASFGCPGVTYYSARQVPSSQSVICKMGQIMLIS